MGIKRYIRNLLIQERDNSRVVNLRTRTQKSGDALLSYGTKIFENIQKGKGFSNRHSTGWEIYTISQLLMTFGYDVDVIDYTNESFVPRKEYSMVIDVLSNLERLAPLLPDRCIKIFHPCWSHWVFHNQAVYSRIFALKERRNIVLKPKKLIKPNLSADSADVITQRGNGFIAETYSYTNKPALKIRHSPQFEYDRPPQKNYDACRKNFIWIGGFGCVSKGLDLLLDVFSELTDHHLYICSRVSQEPDFVSAFDKELNHTANIHNMGFVEVNSEEFDLLQQKCVALVYPTCTDLSSGAVITSMHAGFIPVVSKACGVDVGDFGYILEKCSVNEIRDMILTISSAPIADLEERSLKGWEHAKINHTQKGFEEDYQKALDHITKHQA
jgi:glycosyltransferase involved in cell wall biosynthesis